MRINEENVLFNDTLNTFYFWLYGRHMVTDHSDSEKENPLPPQHVLLFPISSKASFIYTISCQDSTYHDLCCTSRGALAGIIMNEGNGSLSKIETYCLPPFHWFLSPISSKGSFCLHHPTDNIVHTTAFVLAGTRNNPMNPPCGINPKTHCIISRHSTMRRTQHILSTVIWRQTYGLGPF